MKKLLLLGGLRYLIPVIQAAHEQGYYVITADYLPDGIAHKYSDEYVNVSVIDKDAVLAEAGKRGIDGVMSFACDPGVVTAAYVQKELNLPMFGPYESVEILQNKDKFRMFLREHGFAVPKAKGYESVDAVLVDENDFDYPVIIKPTDSAGSKGVSRVDAKGELKPAAENAFFNSLKKRVIVEDFIETDGHASDSDCFSIGGNLHFASFSTQYFDRTASNPYTPSAYGWPSSFSRSQEKCLKNEIQRLIRLLKMETAVYNVETRIGKDGKAYIMEVSPRGGGNRLSEMIRCAYGVDLITASVRSAVGDAVSLEHPVRNGYWAEIILHGNKNGKFAGLSMSDGFEQKYVRQIDLWVSKGNGIESFNGANNAIGTMVLQFDTNEELRNVLENQNAYFKIEVE